MTIPVGYEFRYLTTREGGPWGNDEITASQIVKAVKGKHFNGFFDAAVGGQSRRFYPGTVKPYVNDLCRRIAERINARTSGSFVIVPVPNTSAVVGVEDEFSTQLLAREIVAASGGYGSSRPALRWSGPMRKASDGGTRNPHILYSKLQLGALPPGELILVDDVMTTGGHLKACFRKLAAAGRPPTMAFVFARTTWSREGSPLEAGSEDLAV